MQCPICGQNKLMNIQAKWYCPICNCFVSPMPAQRPAISVSSIKFQTSRPARKVFGRIALAIPLLFLILPQVSCSFIGTNSFTGLSLVQYFTGGGGGGGEMVRESSGMLVMFAVLMLVLACMLAGLLGLVSLKEHLVPSSFSWIGTIGLVASGLGMVAIGDPSLQGANARLEPGFYLIACAFLLLALAPIIEVGLGGASIDISESTGQESKSSDN